MKSTWSYFKGKLRRRTPTSTAASERGGGFHEATGPSEWDDDDGPPPPRSLSCKNRRVTDGSLFTCIGADVSSLAEKTRVSRSRAWRCLESRWWLSGSRAAPPLDGGPTEDRGLLPPAPQTPPDDPAEQPLLLQHLHDRRRGGRLRRAASDDDWTASSAAFTDADGLRQRRRNSLSELDENIGSDLPPLAWAAACCHADPAEAAETPACPTADLLDIGDQHHD